MPPKGGTQTAATRQAIGQGMKKTHAAREAKKAKKTAADLEAEQQERTRFIQSMGSRPSCVRVRFRVVLLVQLQSFDRPRPRRRLEATR